MNKKMLIICAVFALISSCKNYAIKDLEQKTKGQVNGFLDKISDSVKNKITSSGPKVDEVAKKLQEEDSELMPGDDPNGSIIALQPVLPESSQDNTPALKAEQQSGGQQEKGKVKEVEAKVEEKKLEDNKEKQEGKGENTKEKEVIEEQQKKEEFDKEERERKAKEERERKAKEERERKEAEARAEEERREREEEEKQKKQTEDKIKDLLDKIAKINGDIDDIKGKMSVGATEVKDKVTGPVYDDFTDDEDNAIYKTWGGGDLEEEESSELGKLLKELSDSRDNLRTKLNEDNKPHTGYEEPKLKDNVNVSEIKDDLEKVKSGLEKVKGYLENKDNFETIKEYITDSNDDYE
ncbi:ErpC protein [Borreliella carolinensis]|uniref:ErpC protein n=1 Tax=Borreliella carolinensis TaxID=478174 RepID=A0ACD5GLF3_9SPIR